MEEYNSAEIRHQFGEAYVICEECGAKLNSTDGKEDILKPCPDKETNCESDQNLSFLR